MKEMLLYTGCTTPVRLSQYESATIAVLEKLGVHLTEMKDANCCGAQYIESLSRKAFAAMSGRILALGERFDLDVLAICGACSGSLKHNKHLLDNDKELRDEVNTLLAQEDLEYTGKNDVKHLLQVLHEDIGYDKIAEAIVKPYSGIKLAAHYGCHVTRPYDIVHVDDPETPTIIDRIIEIAGGIAVDYAGKTRCCGGPMLAMDPDIATTIGLEKINNVIAAGAQGLLTACEFCDIQLTQVQFGEELDASKRIPVFPVTQFLGAAMGIEHDILGIYLNKISPEHLLETLQEV
jgi:heterodisulfide reductase subunit B